MLVPITATAAAAATPLARLALSGLFRGGGGRFRRNFGLRLGSRLRPLPIPFGAAALVPPFIVMSLATLVTAAPLLCRRRRRTFRPAAGALPFTLA